MNSDSKKIKQYSIHVEYDTGDSFKSWETSDVIEYTWDNLEMAKASLERIEEHYLWYKDQHRSYGNEKIPKPEWLTTKDEYHYGITLLKDDGEEFSYGAPWLGYFEHLKTAEIISRIPDGMKIEF